MGRRHSKPEEIIAKLREVEVRMGRGETAAHAIRATGSRSKPITAGVASMAG